MAHSCNGTQPGGEKQTTDTIFDDLPSYVQWAFWAIIATLFLSLSWNVFCCVSKCWSGGEICRPLRRRRRSSRQMEDNPIYGNINYMQTSVTLFAEVEPAQSSSLRAQQRVNSESQSKNQDCYANLTLKAPRVQSGRSSPQIHYSDVVHLEEPTVESDKEDDGNTDAISTLSDLYASVQTQRTKTIDTDSGEGYANHL